MAKDMATGDISSVEMSNAVHRRLDDIGAPGCSVSDTAFERLYAVRDRLYLRAEVEPDCADLVGKINELCDREGIPEGSPVERVEALAERCREAASELERQVKRCSRYIDRVHQQAAELASLRADLEAERAQLAAKARSQPPFAAFIDDALHYVTRCGCDSISAVCNGHRVTIEPVEGDA